MAATLYHYRQDWEERVKHNEGFTLEAFQQQLSRALAAYDHHRTGPAATLFPTDRPSALQTKFLDKISDAKNKKKYVRFLPWTPEGLAFSLS
jgi:hypothetical protein